MHRGLTEWKQPVEKFTGQLPHGTGEPLIAHFTAGIQDWLPESLLLIVQHKPGARKRESIVYDFVASLHAGHELPGD